MGKRRLLRRSRFLIFYWHRAPEILVVNYAVGTQWQASPLALDILSRLDDWTAVEALITAFEDGDGVCEVIENLLAHSIVESMTSAVDSRERAMERWGRWNPAAGFFHQATRDVRFASRIGPPPVVTASPCPPPLKSYPEAEEIDLPVFEAMGELPGVLLERRTWRQFGSGGVSLEKISTLLGLCWGVQEWVPLKRGGPVALKTSPSGGARHSLEVYLLAFDVKGLPRGTYHYDPDGHRLARLAAAAQRASLKEFLPAQEWFHGAAAVFFTTSVFERVQWKYGYARAYRTVLLEAGHFSQTFLLAATHLGLAPFCTAALGDSAVERHLGIDGIGESVLFANGVGPRPEGVDWAPFPEGEEVPEPLPPAWQRSDDD